MSAIEAGDEGRGEGRHGPCLVQRSECRTGTANGPRHGKPRTNARKGPAGDGNDGGGLWDACLSMKDCDSCFADL